jgi:hypothetical protein
MSFASVSRGHAVATALLVAFVAPAVAAQTGGGGTVATGDTAAGAPSSAPQPTGPLAVWVDAHGEAFDKVRLQASLARELGREVVLTDDAMAAAVQIQLDGPAHADVRYTTPSGERLSRRVELPPDRERAVQVVSWLTGNLVRDEASELLRELRARRKEEADARAQQDAADKAAADKAVADKAAADKAAADNAAADKAAAEAARQEAQPARPDEADARPREDLLRDPLRSVDAAFATPLSFLRDSPKRELHLQLALGYGDSGAIVGAGVAPGILRLRRDLLGVTVGGAAVFVGGNARGVIVGAGYSQLDGTLEGVQLGGGAAIQRGVYARGAVVAVGGAIASDVNGAVVGGGFATAKSLHGVGVSVGLTLIRGRSEGVLLGGGATSSVDHRGVAISAGANIARDLDGIALAPINVHRRVKGIQFGIVNVAEQVDGAAIGVLSFAKNGRVQPLLWAAAPDGSLHVGIKSIAGYVFTQLGAGMDIAPALLIYDAGVGMHFRVGQSFFLEPGVHYSVTQSAADASGASGEHQLHYLAQVGVRVGNKLDLLVGAGVRHTVSGGSGSAIAPDFRAGIAFF